MSQATEAYNKKYGNDLSQENFENLYKQGNQEAINEYNQTEYGKQESRKAMALAKYNERYENKPNRRMIESWIN